MACVTLKRPIDVLGSPHLAEIQPLAKRKRCGPPLFATTPSPNRGVKRAKRRLDPDDAYSPNSGPSSPVRSPFLGAVPPTEPGKEKGQETDPIRVYLYHVFGCVSCMYIQTCLCERELKKLPLEFANCPAVVL